MKLLRIKIRTIFLSVIIIGLSGYFYLIPLLKNYPYVLELGHKDFFENISFYLPFGLGLTGLFLVLTLTPYLSRRLSIGYWRLQAVLSYLITLLLIVFVGLSAVFLHWGFDATIHGQSMNPTLTTQEKVIVKYLDQYQRFDVVAFVKGEQPLVDTSKYLVKRIIGLPGDQVRWVNHQLYINEQLVEEPYLGSFKESEDFLGVFKYQVDDQIIETTIIPEGYLFVMGDNRQVDASLDSRHFGLIKYQQIIGQVKYHLADWLVIK